MPQSRHRKTNKARKRPRSAHSPTVTHSQSVKSRNLRIGAIILIVIVAVSAVAYVIANRGTQSGTEITTASGLKYVDLKVGDGVSPRAGQTVTVHYIGTLENGKQFENSYESRIPADFRIGVGAVVKGWDEGLMSMKVGGKRKLTIPSALAYGQMGRPPDIPANATLVFEVELLGVK